MTMNLNCILELDRGLLRPDELTPISQALIPQELACAFNIPHLNASSTCADVMPPSSDGQYASRSAFESLLRMRSVLLPSLEYERKGEAEASVCQPSYTVRTDGEDVKPFKDANNQNPVVSQAEAGALKAGSFSSSSPGHEYGCMFVQGNANGLSTMMSPSYSHMPETSGADVSLARTFLEDGKGGSSHTAGGLITEGADLVHLKLDPKDGKGGCGHVLGGLITEGADLLHLKLDPNEEVDSGPSAEPIQGSMVALCSEDQSARTLKKPRLVWTPQLHKRFVDAVAQLGIKHAVPKTIMQLMNVDGLTRENVASHLQKYRIYLKRMQGLSTEGPTSSDHLFASTPVPPSLAASHFLVSHHSHPQHRELAFGPMRGTSLPNILGHNAHHLPSHVGSPPMASFSGFDTRSTLSTFARPPAPPLISSEHVRENYGPPASSPSGRVLTFFPSGGS